MAVTIREDTAGAGTYIAKARIGCTADGTIWVCQWVNAVEGYRYEFWYSTDDGANWTENTDLRISGFGSYAFAINTVRDIAVLYLEDSVYAIVGLTTSSSSWTDTGLTSSNPPVDMVVFDKPSSTNFYTAAFEDGGVEDNLVIREFTSAGAYVARVGNFLDVYADGLSALDFHHTGDGNTVADGTPHIYTAGSQYQSGETGDSEICKFTYSGGTWTQGSVREVDAYNANLEDRSVCFDGSRWISAVSDDGTIRLFERDAADLTGVKRTGDIPAPGGSHQVRVSHDNQGNLTLWNVNTTTDDVSYVIFDRTAGTWGLWTELANYGSGLYEDGFSVLRYSSQSRTPAVWLVDVFGSNFDVDTDTLVYLEQRSATGSASIALSASGDVSTVNTVGTSSLVLAAPGTVVARGPVVTGDGSFALAASATVVKTDSGGPWQDFTDGVTSSTGATVTGLTPGSDYEFRVAAVNDIDQGPWSNVATTTT